MNTIKMDPLSNYSVNYMLAEKLGAILLSRNLKCAVAESCTGGSLAAAITDIPGSSQWFDRGFVTYSNESKQQMLGVSADLIASDGAVSEAVVRAMAEGAIKTSSASISVAISGVAGPDGGSLEKPVGSVWIAWADALHATQAQYYWFAGDRQAVGQQAITVALKNLIQLFQI